jgi:hypothetical protein
MQSLSQQASNGGTACAVQIGHYFAGRDLPLAAFGDRFGVAFLVHFGRLPTRSGASLIETTRQVAMQELWPAPPQLLVHALRSRAGIVTVGRARGNGLVVDDLSVSKLHAVLLCDASGTTIVRDAGSLNGTFIDDRRVDEGGSAIDAGSQLHVGSVAMLFLDARAFLRMIQRMS